MKLNSFDVTFKFADLDVFDINLSPSEALQILAMPSICDSIRSLIPVFAPDSPVEEDCDDFELPEMSKKEG